LIFNCIQASEELYDPQYHTAEKAKADAKLIFDKGQGKWGTDEKAIFKVLCASPPQHVMNIDRIYADDYGYSLWKAMEKEMSGDAGKATRHMIAMKTKPYAAMAAMIKAACHGIGTDELVSYNCLSLIAMPARPIKTSLLILLVFIYF
jgi:annexin A13